MGRPGSASLLPTFLFFLLLSGEGRFAASPALSRRSPPPADGGLCARLIRPLGYPCIEHTIPKDLSRVARAAELMPHTVLNQSPARQAIGGKFLHSPHKPKCVQTTDGFLLAVQHIPHGKKASKVEPARPVFLQHGLFQGGDTWFLNPPEESLGFILADRGFDVWIGNVRGTHWSHGHASLSENERAFWDWSWQELAEYDLMDMIKYVYSSTNSKVFFVGHSQGTIMGLAALTLPDIVGMIEAAALLCPISYLDHISAPLVLRAVRMHLDQMLLTMGIHQLNFRSDVGIQILDSLCDGHMDCANILSSITGKNCCFNGSRVDYYLEYEPHPSSVKNINHLFQMIRKGTFARYDYGIWGNLKHYGHLHPPTYDLADIPDSLPLWLAYGGNDALADVTDVKRAIKSLRSEPELVYLDSYGHIDFIYSVHSKADVYDKMLSFFSSWGQASST